VQPVINVTGDPSKQPAVIKFEGVELTKEDIERINAMLKGPHVQAPAITTAKPGGLTGAATTTTTGGAS
jgi:hypothetical protein